jgi:integrase
LGKPRRFQVPSPALDALAEHRTEQDRDKDRFGDDYQNNDLVFCQPGGKHYSPDCLGARVAEVIKKCGLEGVSVHSLRHTHASELLSQGVLIPTVAKRLGHANANVTLSIYAHALEVDELAAAETWNTAMAKVIDTNRRRPERSLAKSSADGTRKLQVIEKIAS